MCRWMAYSGDALPIEELVFKPEHSLIDQSLSARMSELPTNADGFGLGWYGREHRPGTYHSIQPAWNDENLRDLSFHIASPLFLAHVRHATGTPVQTSNCHPFRHENWLFVHNGLLCEFQKYRRDMAMEIAPGLFPELRGNTDSELMFYLALTFGLKDDPLAAIARMAGFIERLAERHGVENAIQMSLGFADGQRLYAVRYSTERNSRTLYYSETIDSIFALYPEHARLDVFPKNARAVVSEPLGSLEGVWTPIDESTAVIVEAGDVTLRPFTPQAV